MIATVTQRCVGAFAQLGRSPTCLGDGTVVEIPAALLRFADPIE
ncbi:hypothetical protein [Actinophytocola sp.]|nr:hypothetical protein [Actinophytocola sp.]